MPLSRTDFVYELPQDLIAQTPASERSASRLLVLDPIAGSMSHRGFSDLVDLLRPEDLLVVNDTKVIPARLFARKDSGGQAEILLERVVGEHEALCHVRVSKPLKAGRRLTVAGSAVDLEVVGRCGELYRLRFPAPVLDVLEHWGEVPLPPYIERPPEEADAMRYQTVYAEVSGAVAAPTAGLHFDEGMLAQLRERAIETRRITLHVGAGTFQPVRVDDVTQHRMHREWLRVPQETVDAVHACRQRGGRVVAVGTTVVRALETAARDRALAPYTGETDIFIYPPFRFRVVDAILTNFHLPESTLLMLVSAFAGRRFVLDAYAAAVAARYRFFSFGDATFIERRADDGARADAL